MLRLVRFIALVHAALALFLVTQAGDAQPRQETRATRWTRVGTQAEQKYIPGEVLVRFKTGVSQKSRQAAHSTLNARVLKSPRAVDRLDLVKLSAGTTVEEAVRSYRKNPDVLYAEPNYIVRALGLPNDLRFPEMWGLNNTGQNGGAPDADIDAVEAWDITTGSSDVVVAVIDTGIDYTHPDLAPNLFQNTADCNTNGIDDDGNGFVDDCYGRFRLTGQ